MLKPTKLMVACAASLLAGAATARITIEDLNAVAESAWNEVGQMKACSDHFPSIRHDALALKLDQRTRKLLDFSPFESENFDEVFAGKVMNARQVENDAILGMLMTDSRKDVQKWCDSYLVSANHVLNRINTMIRSARK